MQQCTTLSFSYLGIWYLRFFNRKKQSDLFHGQNSHVKIWGFGKLRVNDKHPQNTEDSYEIIRIQWWERDEFERRNVFS